MTDTIKLDFISDVVCPWCIIGYKRLENAINELGIQDRVVIEWQPFELNPDMPDEGENVQEHIIRKYGTTLKEAQHTEENIAQLGAELDFRFDFFGAMKIVNTRDAHILLDHAKESGKQTALKIRLFNAYFNERKDISDQDTLLQELQHVGLDADEARLLLKSNEVRGRIKAEEVSWRRLGVSSVPTLVFNRESALAGAQSVDVYKQVLTELLSMKSPNSEKHTMSKNDYTPPKVWTWDSESGGKWAGINRPIAGSTHEKTLPVGDKPLQLYSLGTPNGVKITIMLEELLAMGNEDAGYDFHIINIGEGEQFGSDFVKLNPNSKIPVLLDQSTSPPQSIFESCAILYYLAEKYGAFLPEKAASRTECLSWLFWQESSASFLGGGFGHFYSYAPYPMKYPIDRYAMESKRQLDVLDRHLAEHEMMCDTGYSIADIAIWPWYGRLAMGEIYNAAEFLDTVSYKHVLRWAKDIQERKAVQKGLASTL